MKIPTMVEISVTRYRTRNAARRTLWIVVLLMIVVLSPLALVLLGSADSGTIVLVVAPFAAFGLALVSLFVSIARSRGRQSAVRIADGGVHPLWQPRDRFAPVGRVRFQPWVVTALDTPQGACVTLWCKSRSFIIGCKGAFSKELSVQGDPVRDVDCEVSRNDFDYLIEALYGSLPVLSDQKSYRDLPLVSANYGFLNGLKGPMLPWLVTMGAIISFVAIASRVRGAFDSPTGIGISTLVTVVLLIGGVVFTVMRSTIPRRPARILRISARDIALRESNGRISASTPLSRIDARGLCYRYTTRAVRIRLPVVRLSFGGATIRVSSPTGSAPWTESAKRSGAPQYLLSSHDWDFLLSALASRLRVGDETRGQETAT